MHLLGKSTAELPAGRTGCQRFCGRGLPALLDADAATSGFGTGSPIRRNVLRST